MSGNVGMVYNLTPNGKEIPSIAQQSGKFLTNNGTVVSWADVPPGVFVAEYAVTSSSDINNAVEAGKAIFVFTDEGYIAPACIDQYSSSLVTMYVVYNGTSKTYNIQGTTWTIQNGKQIAWTDHTHGNIKSSGTLQTSDITIASGDKLVVTDASNSSQIARASISFDGSTTGSYLSKKGTWEAIPYQNDIFWCVYDTTTNEQIETAIAAGKIPMIKNFAGTYQSSAPCVAPLVCRLSETHHVFANIEKYLPANAETSDDYTVYINFADVSLDVWTTGGSALLRTNRSHADASTAYGTGSSTYYGHVKLSASTSSTSGTTSGTAATPSAVKSAYDRAGTLINRSTAVNAADANYTTLMARGEKLLDSTTYDAKTDSDWLTELVNGSIAWRYE